jgi:CubicO group peptidase (beta-lactamase class C family)
MRYFRLWIALASTCLGTSAAAKPLAEAARIVAAEMPAGCIVTGDCRGQKVEYSIAGRVEPAGARPESLLFEMGSITKTFTGLLLAQAVVEGKVKLDTKVSDLLAPNFKFNDPRVGQITLVQLSTHTSGLPRMPANFPLEGPFGTLGDPYAKYDEKLMLEFLSRVKLAETPTFQCSYSNYGVGLLGTLLGRVYHQSWESLILDKICRPLGLSETRMDISASKLPLAPPHKGAELVKSWNFDSMAPAGALRTTAADLMKYGQAVMHPEKTPLSAAFSIALKPHADTGKGKIGLGWFINSNGSLSWLIHNGSTGGYSTIMEVVPAREVIHVVLVNNSSHKADSVLAEANGTRKKAGSAQE